MKELDFDELDRAVNSLMEGVPKDKQSPQPFEDSKDTTLTISPTLEQDAKPDFAKVNVQAGQSAAATQPVPSTPSSSVTVPARTPAATAPASRRGGRFMDVVHPSSDMKQPTAPSRPVSREGVTIAPSVSVPTTPAVEPPAPEAPAVKPTEDPSATTTEPASEWPDPLDMADFKKEPEPAEITPADNPEENDKKEEKSSTEPAAPLTSPFLADAKVEKRPLGGAPAVSDDDLLTPEDINDDAFTTSDPNDQLPADPEKLDTPLPEELRSDLVAIESGAHMEQHAENSASDVPVEKEIKEEDKKDTAPEEEKKPAGLPPASKEATSETAPASTGPTSIAQQYKEEPSSGDQSNGAIYDTDTYHQPLEHPVKKKSGWMWVVWILLILLVGAGGGAALYFLGLI